MAAGACGTIEVARQADIAADDVETLIPRDHAWPETDAVQTGGGRFAGRLRYLETASTDIDMCAFDTPIIMRWLVGDDRVHLVGPIRLDPQARLLGRRLGATRTMLLRPGCEGFFASRSSGISWSISVDKERLAGALRMVYDCSLEAGFEQGWATAWTAAGLDVLVQRLLREPRSTSTAALDALVIGAVADRLAGPGTPLAASAAYRLARRARDLLLDTADAPLGVPALTAALGVGQRTVFNAFNEVFGLSPFAFQRALQHDRVRRRLRSAPPQATVTMLALDEGVEHLGRFAGAYRRQFGELPSETLRRARAAAQP